MGNATFLAFDFGAESGRAVLGRLEDNKLDLEVVHRFPNGPVNVSGHIHWNVLGLFHEVQVGLKKAVEMTGGNIDGVGVDTWGVDFGLLDDRGELLLNPFHYRDSRTDGTMEELFKTVSQQEVFERTGIQFLPFNTLYQLYEMRKWGSPALFQADCMLMMADLFHYWLTGEKVVEFSNATTSQCFNPLKGDWAYDMLDKLGIPTKMLPEVVQPGTKIGQIAPYLMQTMGGIGDIDVIVPATHDTGSAVAAVPAEGDCHAYISSGTWSLMGVELNAPLINGQALELGFTNEGGVDGTYRFLTNIMGLWIVQECKRTWAAAGEDIDYGTLAQMASESEGCVSIIDPDDLRFMPPGDMPARVQEYCQETGQKVPQEKGEIVRVVLDSLALKYRMTLESIEKLLGKELSPIHIVGGGIQNTLLNQLTADATGKPVVTGPVEATAMGNLLVQAMGKGIVGSLDEARQVVRNSVEVNTYQPKDTQKMERAWEIFLKLKK